LRQVAINSFLGGKVLALFTIGGSKSAEEIDTLLRTDDGSFVLYMTSKGQVKGEERILFLGCRDALVWLDEAPDALGSYWHFAEANL
jgi:hypothetical protein